MGVNVQNIRRKHIDFYVNF